MRITALIGVIGLVTGSDVVLAATFHVSETGSDSNPGTLSQPFRTVQQGAESAQAGDTVLVGPGNYDEMVRPPRGGTASARITFDGQGGATVRRFYMETAYLTVKNFKLTGDALPGSSAIEMARGCHYALITNNVINTRTNAGVRGIQMAADVFSDPTSTGAPHDCLIISNYIGNVLGAAALGIGGRNNVFENNTVTNLYTADFVRLFGYNNVLRNNRFLNDFYMEGIGYHPDFIQTFGDLQQGSRDHIIEGNIVSNIVNGQLCQMTMQSSFDSGQHGSWIIRNNIFVDIALQASAGIPNNQWINNVFIRCSYQGGPNLALGYTDGRSNAGGAVVMNNVFLDCGLPDRNNSGWYSITVDGVTADYNFVSKINYGPVRQAASPTDFGFYELHGINGGNPRFAGEGRLDLRLRADSPLIDKGTTLADARADMAGVARPQGAAFDIGVLEYTGQALEGPAAPLNLRVVTP